MVAFCLQEHYRQRARPVRKFCGDVVFVYIFILIVFLFKQIHAAVQKTERQYSRKQACYNVIFINHHANLQNNSYYLFIIFA